MVQYFPIVFTFSQILLVNDTSIWTITTKYCILLFCRSLLSHQTTTTTEY